MGKSRTDKPITVRVLIGKKECDNFQKGIPHRPMIIESFSSAEDAAEYCKKYRMEYRPFAFFVNKSIPIKPLEYSMLEFVQYEFK